MQRFCLSLFLILFCFSLGAQLPSTEVWLYKYKYKDSTYVFDDGGQNISNHPGYDNQPSFSPDGRFMVWTSMRDSGGTDIFRYDLKNRASTQFTNTSVSEYSPTYMPGKKFISCVVVEKDSTQRLYKYNKKTAEADTVLLAFTGVGYSCWFDANTVFLFKITEPSTLWYADVKTGTFKKCGENVGRCMQVCDLKTVKLLPYDLYAVKDDRVLLYTTEEKEGFHIRAMSGTGEPLEHWQPILAPAGSQDFVVDKHGNILMAGGNKLYLWRIGASTSWKEIADFKNTLHKITRMALSPDGQHLALVDNLD